MFGPINTGGGATDLSAKSSLTNGDNKVGGTVFGNYNPAATVTAATGFMPWLIGGAVVLGALFIIKGGK